MGMINDFYSVWDNAFSFFNAELFDGSLPDVGFTVEKQNSTRAYFHANQFVTKNDGRKVHKISMDTGGLGRTDKESMSTFVHEMAHLWQVAHGAPGRGKYHNAQWVAKMHTLGLPPMSASTGAKGTGDKVSHSIEAGGAFDEAFKVWQARGLKVGWHGLKKPDTQQQKAKRKSKTKYTHYCQAIGEDCNVWGKPDMLIVCGECDGEYVEES